MPDKKSSIEKHEWAYANKKMAGDEVVRLHVNSDATVISAYTELMTEMNEWYTAKFGVGAGILAGRPAQPMPCTYMEWSGILPVDVYAPTGDEGQNLMQPQYGLSMRRLATTFRQAVRNAWESLKVKRNIDRMDGGVNTNPDGLPGD